tara:strand:- start:14580 stop:14798 length:219 start_codon:yes stop_codon:yes gene_type:complete
MAIDTIGTTSSTAATGRGLSEAITKIDFGAWTVTESGGALFFAHNGANKIKLDSSGNIDMSGDVNSNDSSIT